MTIILDGRRVDFDGHPTVLEVAKANGVDVPSLCDHPALEPYAACRLCLVEVEGRKGYLPACHTAAEDGMVVRTATPELVALRRGILELILAEHPHACLICREKPSCDDFKSTIRKTGEVTGCVLCPANGRCGLQKAVAGLGLDVVPFPSLRREGEVRRDDPFIDRDNGLCILCGRCVRVCREVRGATVLTFVARGPSTFVGTALDRRLVDSGCQFCGACVDVCPTGSLMERATRYSPLPDAEKNVVCPLCAQGCRLNVALKDGRALSAAPDADGPANRGQACVRGRFLLRTAIEHPRRLLNPLIREKGALREASWEEALSAAAGRLAGIGPGEVAVTASGQSSCEDLFALHKLAAEAFKTASISGSWEGSAAALLRELGRASGAAVPLNFRLADIGSAASLILLDEDLAVSHPMAGLEVHRAAERGTALLRVVRVEGRGGFAAGSGGIRLPEGREELLLTALAALAPGKPSGAFKKRLDAFDPGQAARALGIPKKALQETAHRLFFSAPALFLFGPRFVSGEDGPLALAALWNLARLVGGRLLPLDTEANTRGALAIAWAFEAKTAAGGGGAPRRALYLAGPVPKLEREGADFVVLQAAYAPEGLENADVVLPEATAFESEGILVNVEGRLQVSTPAAEPLCQSKPGWWIASSLGAKLGAPGFLFGAAAAVREALAAAVPAFGNLAGGVPAGKDAFLAGEAGGEPGFVEGKALAGRPAGFPRAVFRNPDDTKGLNLARENKSLKLVRERR